jgi:hypothetical protein
MDIYKIINQSYAVAAQDDSENSGANLVESEDNGSPDRHWILIPASSSGGFNLRNERSGLNLGVRSQSGDPSQVVQLAPTDGLGQQWSFTPLPDGKYKIMNLFSHMVLSVPNGQGRGAQLWQGVWWGGADQQWNRRLVKTVVIKFADASQSTFACDPENVNVPTGEAHVELCFVLSHEVATEWKFSETKLSDDDFYGITIEGDDGTREFHDAKRVSDTRVVVIDNNDNARPTSYQYCVALMNRNDG